LKQLLVLFDVDGTLFLTHDPLAGRALRETLEQRYQVELRPDAEEHVDHRGQTALRIARLVLDAAGLQANAIDEGSTSGATASRSATSSSWRRSIRRAGSPRPAPNRPSAAWRKPASASRS
jgi:beta-phosphoglucomutase-like phosphatase (HAD superfamily)